MQPFSMSLISLTDPDGNEVLVRADAVVRVRLPSPAEFPAPVCAVLDLDHGIQAVRENMRRVRYLIDTALAESAQLVKD